MAQPELDLLVMTRRDKPRPVIEVQLRSVLTSHGMLLDDEVIELWVDAIMQGEQIVLPTPPGRKMDLLRRMARQN